MNGYGSIVPIATCFGLNCGATPPTPPGGAVPIGPVASSSNPGGAHGAGSGAPNPRVRTCVDCDPNSGNHKCESCVESQWVCD